ncbi:apolipoprotein N-acyltransferase [Castellaniella denitrificans]|uniref:Apolipoprotein N-acyltransferase n=1 Tax=Castellaniella denitrificans TaxID=56119 RepID=A0ABT4M6A6_9BURK|nr:apolipoprotein N-acyltransferase [Castellaniella denitrificans]MCZ4329666.1 apolipoprotein N-acyltransferase [Castellaniella denitrificans]
MPPESAAAPPAARRAWRGPLTALLAGSLQALCFAPGPLPAWGLPFVQIATLAVLAALTFQAPGPRRAAGLGWLFGLAQFGIGVYWLTVSMHEFGGLPLPLAIAALLLFSAAMAVYGAGACALTAWLCAGHGHPERRAPRQILNAVAWASAWTLAEWLRGTLFTGFTWLNVGYAHVEGMFAAWAPFAGVYGLAWLAAFSAAAVALMARAKDTAYDRSAAAVVGLALLAGLLGIAWGHIGWSRPLGEPLMVRLVQPATPQSDKFQPDLFLPTQARIQRLAALAPKSEADRPAVVILPETVLPIFQDQVPDSVWRQWRETAESMRATFVLGAPLHIATPVGDRYTNGAIALRPRDAASPTADPVWHYDKRHLVPFGEFIPPGFHWFVRAMRIPLGDFDRGPAHQPPLAIGDQLLAFDICYEDAFGEEIAATVAPDGPDAPGPSILANLSNLAWFGNGWALRQHLWIARMRALETARPVVRATNTGATAVIDARGQVRGVLDPGRPGVLDAEVQGTQGLTPYVRWGNAPILIWTLLGLLLAVRSRRRYEPA